jgi:hypothetical protein
VVALKRCIIYYVFNIWVYVGTVIEWTPSRWQNDYQYLNNISHGTELTHTVTVVVVFVVVLVIIFKCMTFVQVLYKSDTWISTTEILKNSSIFNINLW